MWWVQQGETLDVSVSLSNKLIWDDESIIFVSDLYQPLKRQDRPSCSRQIPVGRTWLERNEGGCANRNFRSEHVEHVAHSRLLWGAGERSRRRWVPRVSLELSLTAALPRQEEKQSCSRRHWVSFGSIGLYE